MKRRDIILMSAIFVITSLLAVQVTYGAILNKPLFTLSGFAKSSQYQPQSCSAGKSYENLKAAESPELQKLAIYQELCQGSPTNQLMLFTDMPNSKVSAVKKAGAVAKKLKEFQQVGIVPLVVLEPITEWGDIDFIEFKRGFYDSWLNTYFSELKKSGLDDAAMGTWLPFPEANLPYWNHQNSKPDDFAVNVTKVAKSQKKYFPTSKTTIMLNSATYENEDFNWENGEYVSLLPYVKNIPDGLIDSFGLQGLPWMPDATGDGVGVLDSSEYLSPALASEAADELKVKSIWFNTGTFASKYTLDQERTVHMTPEQRKDILTNTLEQAKKLQTKGFSVAINLFSEDKSDTEEATDWSYWHQSDSKNSPGSVVFADFAVDTKESGVELWLFDR